jgi:hypothetical protein
VGGAPPPDPLCGSTSPLQGEVRRRARRSDHMQSPWLARGNRRVPLISEIRPLRLGASLRSEVASPLRRFTCNNPVLFFVWTVAEKYWPRCFSATIRHADSAIKSPNAHSFILGVRNHDLGRQPRDSTLSLLRRHDEARPHGPTAGRTSALDRHVLHILQRGRGEGRAARGLTPPRPAPRFVCLPQKSAARV